MHRTTRVSLAALAIALGATAFAAAPGHAGSAIDKAETGAIAVVDTTGRVANDTIKILGTARGEQDDYDKACGNSSSSLKQAEDTVGFFQGRDNDCVEQLRDNPFQRRMVDNAMGMGAPAVLGLDTPDVVDVYDFATDIRDDPANADKKVAGLVPGTVDLVFQAADSITDPGQMARNVDDELVGTYQDLRTTKTYQAITDTKLGRAADGLIVDVYHGGKKLGGDFAKSKTGRTLGKGYKWVANRTFKPANKWVNGAREDAMPVIRKGTETTRKMLRSDTKKIAGALKPAFQQAGRTLTAIRKDPRKIEGLTVSAINKTTDAALDGLDLVTNRKRLAETTQRVTKSFAKTVSRTATYQTLSKTKAGKWTIGAAKDSTSFAKKAAKAVAKTKVGGAVIGVTKKARAVTMNGANKLVKKATPGVKKIVSKIVEVNRKPVRDAVTKTVKVTKKVVKVTKKLVKKATPGIKKLAGLAKQVSNSKKKAEKSIAKAAKKSIATTVDAAKKGISATAGAARTVVSKTKKTTRIVASKTKKTTKKVASKAKKAGKKAKKKAKKLLKKIGF